MPSRDTQVGDTSMPTFCLWYVCYHYLYRSQVRALCNPTHKEASMIMLWAFAFQKEGIDRGGRVEQGLPVARKGMHKLLDRESELHCDCDLQGTYTVCIIS